MPLVSMKEMLLKAKAENYAVGQYNINGLEFAQSFLQAKIDEERAPIILAASDRLVDYLGGFKTIVAMVKSLIEEMNITVPVALHLDHGVNVERCKKAIDAGFTSVMIDGSHHPIDENIEMTKQVVDYAQQRNVSVEAEVGTVGGTEDGLVGGIKYADPNECMRIVKEAEIDALARFGFRSWSISGRTETRLRGDAANYQHDERTSRFTWRLRHSATPNQKSDRIWAC